MIANVSSPKLESQSPDIMSPTASPPFKPQPLCPLRRLQHPPPKTPTHSSLCLAVLPLPTPLLALTSTSILVYLAARPLVALSLSLYLRTPVTLSSLRLRPFRRHLQLGGLRLADPHNRHLLSLKSLHLSLRPFPAPAPVPVPPPPAKTPKHLLQITLDSPSVTALFDSNLLTSSNWTLFVNNFRRQPSPPTQPAPAPQPSPASAPSIPIAVAVTNDVHLSLRSALRNNARLIPDVTLSNVSISAADIRTPENIAHFVNSLTARAIASVRSSAFPKEVRSAARKYARRVFKEGVARGIQVTKEKVGDVRRRVEVVDHYVLRGLPDVQGVGARVTSLTNVLKGIEAFLGGGEGPENQGHSAGGGIQQNSAHQATMDRGDHFRELDEGNAKYNAGRQRP